MKTKLVALALGLAAVAAQAAPTFAFKNVPVGWDGAYSIKLTGFESFDGPLAAGSHNFGILKITSIQTVGFGSTTIWNDGDNGAEITGIFSGITLSATSIFGPVFGAPLGGINLEAIGGSAAFYINPVGSFAFAGGGAQGIGGYAAAGGGCAFNTNCYNGISNVGAGGLLLSADYVPGVLGADTVAGGAKFLAGGKLRGSAEGYLSVTGGSAGSLFDTDGFTGPDFSKGPADLNANNTFCSVGSASCATVSQAGDWQLAIDDPVKGSVKVPEPASLALVGLGLLGAGMIRRRKSA